MATLRDPEKGCPWDKKQTYATIAPYTIEEAYEVAEAIETQDFDELRDELGDLLFQVVFYAQIAKEEQRFDFSDVVQAICEKMLRRHPHVFADDDIGTAEQQTERWEKIKAEERAAKKSEDHVSGALDGVSHALPALTRAKKLQSKARRVGFDWPDVAGVWEKIDEECHEVKEAMESSVQDHIEEELGDLMFACVNLARFVNVDPEVALRKANRKFEQRFQSMETMAREQGEEFSELTLDEQEALWQRAKSKLKS